jgi:hypothetical protein
MTKLEFPSDLFRRDWLPTERHQPDQVEVYQTSSNQGSLGARLDKQKGVDISSCPPLRKRSAAFEHGRLAQCLTKRSNVIGDGARAAKNGAARHQHVGPRAGNFGCVARFHAAVYFQVGR